ncbi:MAG: alpha/beta hydrolase family protein [Candidatus Thiodiazotropha sp. (ex Monitilora ramsayi)]|nr:alpha/beta hydrolase family protein [Candidatus Thiodiazotropha sp. (ex Monitilora ramsayi)]
MDVKFRHLRPMTVLVCLASLLVLTSGNTPAANLTLEQRISDQLTTPSLKGNAVWLEAGNTRFLTISKTATTADRVGGVILLHDDGAHADWHEVIAPLRQYLSTRGWDVLSIQLPVNDNPNRPLSFERIGLETNARIQAAVDYFAEQENSNLTLIGHGLGARAALQYLEGTPAPTVRAFVAISLPAKQEDRDNVISAIGKLTGPTLDIYGSLDQPEVTDSAEARRSAGKRKLEKDYRQDRIVGADHYYRGLEENLQRRIGAWLKRVARGVEKGR